MRPKKWKGGASGSSGSFRDGPRRPSPSPVYLARFVRNVRRVAGLMSGGIIGVAARACQDTHGIHAWMTAHVLHQRADTLRTPRLQKKISPMLSRDAARGVRTPDTYRGSETLALALTSVPCFLL